MGKKNIRQNSKLFLVISLDGWEKLFAEEEKIRTKNHVKLPPTSPADLCMVFWGEDGTYFEPSAVIVKNALPHAVSCIINCI